jgi:hypothetical protein
MNTPTVELVMDLSAQRHLIGLVTLRDRVELTPEQTAELISDLSTGMNLALTQIITPAPARIKPTASKNTRRSRKVKPVEIPVLTWHRPEGPGKYVTTLPHGATAAVEGTTKEGWTVVINGQPINNVPATSKKAAQELVQDTLRQSLSV